MAGPSLWAIDEVVEPASVGMNSVEDLERQKRLVEAGARRGAASVTRDRQLVADAIEWTVSAWEDAVLRRKVVRDWGGWAFRTSANAAKRLGRRRRPPDHEELGQRWHTDSRATDQIAPRSPGRTRAVILAGSHILVGRQLQVLLHMCIPGMTLHRAARELGMDRTALRRSFQSGLVRLARMKSAPLPPPGCRSREERGFGASRRN